MMLLTFVAEAFRDRSCQCVGRLAKASFVSSKWDIQRVRHLKSSRLALWSNFVLGKR